MKCEIGSWGQQEANCESEVTGNCAYCERAWNYMSLFGPGSFSFMLASSNAERVGKDLVLTVMFNDDDKTVYKCIITDGKYIHLQKQ